MRLVNTIALVGLFLGTLAQTPVLTFEEALAKTLANNYNIKVAKINTAVAFNNAEKSNNGYLPSVSASGSYGWTFNSGKFETVQGTNEFDPNSSFSYGAGVDVNYTLWDGQGRKYAYMQSKELQELSTIQVMELIQNTILELSRVYYSAGGLQKNLKSLEEAIAISKDRLARAESGYEVGQGSSLDILNAKVDLNTDSVNLVNLQQQLANSIRNINWIMATDIDQQYVVEDEISIDKNLDKEILLNEAKTNNLQLSSLEKSMLVQEFAIGRNRASIRPSVNANVGYDYRGSNDPNGVFVIGSSSVGPNANLGLSWNVFNGQTKAAIKNAQLNLESTKLEMEAAKQQVQLNLLNAYDAYTSSLFILNLQKTNVETAQLNFDRSKEAFRLGQVSSVEFRQAQLNLLNVEIQLHQSEINAKNAELQVLALAGVLGS